MVEMYDPVKDLQIRLKHMKHVKGMMKLYIKQEQVKYPWQLSSDSIYFIDRYYNCRNEYYHLSYDLYKLLKRTKINFNFKELLDNMSICISATDFENIDFDIKILNKLINHIRSKKLKLQK